MKTLIAIAFCFVGLNALAVNPVPKLKKVVWVWLENTPYTTTVTQRYLRNIWLNYPSARFSKFLPVSKITQGNAIAAITGADQGVVDNELTRFFVPSIVDLLESKNIPWRVYAEDFPGSCYLGAGSGDYKRYRTPFISMGKIEADRYLCSKIVSYPNLNDDLRYSQMPQFSVVIPNLKSSGATTSPYDADYALKRVIDPIVTSADALSNTTIVISTINNVDVKRPEMYALILGNGIAAIGQTIATPYNHYNLLRTLEDGLRLGNLNQNDAKVEPMLGFWAP